MTTAKDPSALRREPHVIALSPMPAWISQLFGRKIERAVAWSSGASVTIRASDSHEALRCEHIEGRGWFRLQQGTRAPIALSMTADQRSDLERFAERMRWIAGSGGDYSPAPAERSVLSTCEVLGQIRQPNDAARVECTPNDVQAYLDLLAGRWDRLPVDRSTPAWLLALLCGLCGDFDALRELARSPQAAGPLTTVAGMAFELAGFHAAARAGYESAAEYVFGPERADLCVEIAKLCRVAGDRARAVHWARSALLTRAPSDGLTRRACAELVKNGAFDDAHAVLAERCAREPFERDLGIDLAELLLWAGRTVEARQRIEHAGGDDFRARRCRGILLALEQRFGDAAEELTRAQELCPNDSEITAWLSELELRRGNLAEAGRLLALSRVSAQSAIHVALSTALGGTIHNELSTLLDALGEPATRFSGTPHQIRDAALDLLASFGGNRSELLTRTKPVAGELGLELARLPTAFSVRDASAATLRQIGTITLSELEARFAELAERHPKSPHPLCYWGELELWLGRYEQAIERFDRAMARERARWGHVGKAAALILRGDYDAGFAEIAACDAWFPAALGATTPVYVGEAYRRRGDPAQAIEHLRRAVEAKQGRAGAWMNLALAELELGARDEAERIFGILTSRWPVLFIDAWFALTGEHRWPLPAGDIPALFEKTLEMMRGNRSSHTITYFLPDGSFRIAQSTERWLPPLAKHAPFVAMDLRRRLALGLVGDQEVSAASIARDS